MSIKSSKTLVEEALKEIKTLEPHEVIDLISKKLCNLIDIRDIRELEQQGKVKGANHIPRGMLEFWLDPASPYFKENKIDMSKEMILFCAGGLRSALAAKTLNDMGFKNVSHINGGFALMSGSGFEII